MKIFMRLVLAVGVTSSLSVSAQVDTVFFNKEWKITKDRDSFAYYRPTPLIKDGRYEVRDYFIDGRLQMLGHYSIGAQNMMSDDIDDQYRDGKFEYYYENGKLENEGQCKNGGRIGRWTYHYRDGRVRSATLYRKGKLHGRYTAYDSLNGLPSYTGMNKHDKAVGTWTFFFRGTRQVKSTLTFKNDSLNGPAVYFDSLSGNKIYEGIFKAAMRQGQWKVYDRTTGEPSGVYNYRDGKKHGVQVDYLRGTKQKWIQSHFFDDSLHGELTIYYETGKLKRREVYLSGELVSSACYTEKGDEIECLPLAVLGRFNGDLMTYIGDNLRYPEEAKKNRREGKVLVSFILAKTGVIQYPEVSSGFDAACDAEALRLVSQMPPWEPEYIDGIPVESVKTIPVVFWLPD